MDKSKSKNAAQIPVIPEKLMLERVIEGESSIPLVECIERIESMKNGWFTFHPIFVYTLRADANTAEFIVEMYLANERRGWLTAELHADTSDITDVYIHAGVDPDIMPFFYRGAAAIVVMTLIVQNIWVLVAALGFLAFIGFEMRWAFERQLVKRFQKAAGLDLPK